jgi:hypothetical protein
MSFDFFVRVFWESAITHFGKKEQDTGQFLNSDYINFFFSLGIVKLSLGEMNSSFTVSFYLHSLSFPLTTLSLGIQSLPA